MILTHGTPAFHERTGAGIGVSHAINVFLGEQRTQIEYAENGDVHIYFEFDDSRGVFTRMYLLKSDLFVDDTVPGLQFAPEKTREKTKH